MWPGPPQPAVVKNPPAPVPEAKPAAPEDESEEEFPFLWFPLADGGTFEITSKKLHEYEARYPGVDVAHELERMQRWVKLHTEKQITALYLERLAQKWLSNAGNGEIEQFGSCRNDKSYGSSPSYDIDRAEYLMNTGVPKLKKKNR